jgi:hypothetical protein
MPPPTYPVQYPSTLGYTFGIPQKETGITLETYEQTDTTDLYEQKNEFGEVVEVVLHNARSEITMNGQTTAAMTSMLGLKITIANMVATQVATGGSTICRTVHFTHGRAVNETVRVAAVYYPLILGP